MRAATTVAALFVILSLASWPVMPIITQVQPISSLPEATISALWLKR